MKTLLKIFVGIIIAAVVCFAGYVAFVAIAEATTTSTVTQSTTMYIGGQEVGSWTSTYTM